MIRQLCIAGTPLADKKTASDLSLHEAVGLLALTRTSDVIDKGVYGPIANNKDVPFAPQGDWGDMFLREIWNSGLLHISETSDSNAFVSDEAESNYVFLNRLDWVIGCVEADSLIQDIERCGRLGKLPEPWQTDIEKFRLELALAECHEFYVYCLEKRGFPVAVGQQTTAMLLNLLQDHSVSQCFNIIWRGAQSASDFKLRSKVNSLHAANSMVGTCQRYADRARVENWHIKGFRRNYDRPRSMISYVLYDVLLKIGDEGFTEPLRCHHE